MDTIITSARPQKPLDGPLGQLCLPEFDPFFWRSTRPAVLSGWFGHVPFAHWLVCSARPRVIVELGTRDGVSYAAFCEAVLRWKLDARCFAVDTWRGDQFAGAYGEVVYEELRRFNDATYGSFSKLLRTSFDEAAKSLIDVHPDLLHIDGNHTYEAVKHDFETWLPKMSDRGIVLFHDISQRTEGFGVWKLWEELRSRYPSFTFSHCNGLGVLAVGKNIPHVVSSLCALPQGDAAKVRARFERLGEAETLCCAYLHLPNRKPPKQASPQHPRPQRPPAVSHLAAITSKETELKLGIGIVTYNRPARLVRAVEGVLSHTRHSYELVIADDGSREETRQALQRFAGSGIKYIRARNMGVNWNKNRLLYFLNNMLRCDVTILLEDDSYPVSDAWETKWIDGARRFGHINLAGDWFSQNFMDGDGTVDSPYRCHNVSAQCSAFSREAIERVGFFDPVLGNFGGAHADHSYRMARAGYGGEFRSVYGVGEAIYYLIDGDVGVTHEDSGYRRDDPEGLKRFWERRDQAIHRMPWRNDAEQEQLWQELVTVETI